MAQGRGEASVHDLGEAAEFLLDRFRFPDQGNEDAILGPLLVDEIMAEDFGIRLQLAVDSSVALFHSARIPGDIEMEQVPAMGLEIQAFAGSIGRDQDPYRMLGWIGIEGGFDW